MTTGKQPQNESRPRIVMLLANEFVHDTRVFKQARSLIEWGCAVHVVAIAKPHLPVYEVYDGIHVHRVPMNESRLRHVVAAIGVWWSRRLMQRLLRRVEPESPTVIDAEPTVSELDAAERAQRAPTPTVSHNGAAAPVSDDASHRATGTAGTVGAAAVQSTPTGIWNTNRTLPVRGFRRMLVVYGRTRRRLRTARRRWRAVAGRAATGRDGLAVVYRLAKLPRLLRSMPRRAWKRITSALRRARMTARNRARRLYPPAMRLLAANHRLAQEAMRLKPDVLEAHDLNTLLGALMVRRAAGTPVVYDSHELYLERNIGDKNRLADKLFWWPVERFGIVRCEAVLTVAAGICDHLAGRYRIARPALVRNVQPYEPPAAPSRLLSEELGIDPRRPIVLYPGAITINRGLEQLIESSVHLRDAAYVIMGYARNPAYLGSLKQRAEALGQLNRTVFFRDAVAIEDVVRYTASADLGIVPTQNVCLSYQFESSNKIFHCLMAGVPLVMSDHSEKRQIAETYDVALLFDETSPRAIAEAVHEALSDSERYQRMRRNCLAAAQQLNWEHEEHTLRSVFAGILGDRARPVPEPNIPGIDLPDVEVLRTPVTSGVNANEYSS